MHDISPHCASGQRDKKRLAKHLKNSPKSSCCLCKVWAGSQDVFGVQAPVFLPITFSQDVILFFLCISCCIRIFLGRRKGLIAFWWTPQAWGWHAAVRLITAMLGFADCGHRLQLPLLLLLRLRFPCWLCQCLASCNIPCPLEARFNLLDRLVLLDNSLDHGRRCEGISVSGCKKSSKDLKVC